jgi:organic radical activating enzyme
MEKNFYCSQKFWWLSIDLEKLQTFSCCSATPSRIDLKFIQDNPGELFNSPGFVTERQMMLDNIPVASCQDNCWKPESQGLTSRRIMFQSQQQTHTEINTTPDTLHIIVGTDCNMTCVYCCKEFSSSWARHIDQHGPYPSVTNANRYSLAPQDRVVMKISQKELSNTAFSQNLLSEIEQIYQKSELRQLMITGGEPFLYLGLEDLVSRLSGKGIPIRVWSGLGVDPKRFEKEIRKLSKFPDLEISISAESIGPLYELVRYGNTWQRLQQNIKTLDDLGVRYRFFSTLSNLTLLGIEQFVEFLDGRPVMYSVCTDPEFMGVNVLDPDSKKDLESKLNLLPADIQTNIKNSMNLECKESTRLELKNFLLEFCQRNNIAFTMLPTNFVDWVVK